MTPPTPPPPLDLDLLERVARAATPGPWTVFDGEYVSQPGIEAATGDDEEPNLSVVVYGAEDEPDTGIQGRTPAEAAANAAHIASADPSTVLALVSALRSAREALAAADRWIIGARQHDTARLPDHACAECRPKGGPMLVEGFRCAYHAARARRAALEPTNG